MKIRPKHVKKVGENNDESIFWNYFEKNPEEFKKLTDKFHLGRLISVCQMFNGLDFENENYIRYLLKEYAGRVVNHGLNSLPLSYNIMEPFFNFNTENIIFELVEEEESYCVSIVDFLDFVTSPNFNTEKINLHDNIPEDVMYHFTMPSGEDEISFTTDNGKEYVIGHASLIRRDNEIVVVLNSGEIYDEDEAKEFINSKRNENRDELLTPRKKELGIQFDKSLVPDIVPYLDRDDLWLTIAAARFDIDTRTLDMRFVAKDVNSSFSIQSDDLIVYLDENGNFRSEDAKSMYENILQELYEMNSLFEFAKFCMYLPYYIFENEEKIIQVEYPTKLNELIKGIKSRRDFKNVPKRYKVYSRPFYYVESEHLNIKLATEIKDESLKIETSGYWKRLNFDEKGLDKKGREIQGRTWVEKHETYYKADIATPTKVVRKKRFEGENSGVIYIMRQASMNKDIFKIGLTTRTSEERSKELSNTSVPDKFLVAAQFPTVDCKKAEKFIHDRLSVYRLSKRREFFKVNLELAIQVCREITEQVNNETD